MATVVEESSENKEENVLTAQISVGFLRNSQLIEEIGQLKFKESIPKDFFCSYCNFILWDPVCVENCGHVVCRDCLVRSENNNEEVWFECPKDLVSVENDKIVEKVDLKENILKSVISCIESDCNWLGELSELESHFATCSFKQLVCPQCSNIVKLSDLDNHKTLLCENRVVKCPHCSVEVFWKILAEHEEICPMKLMPCPNNCKDIDKDEVVMLKQGAMETHLNEECLERTLPCPFSDFGCKKNLKLKRAGQHFTKYSILHLANICDNGKISQDQLEVQILALLNLKKKIIENDKRLNEIKLRHGPQLLLKIVNFHEKLEAVMSGKATELASTAFFTSYPYGYKIFLKISITGTAAAAQKYFSIFISICDNNYNALLPWPFQKKIDVHLINQVNSDHITHSIIPNIVKENFPFIQRPTNQKNPFFGIEKFAKLNILDDEKSNFVIDETLFIKVVVDPHDIV